jgi:hypothetical protein
VIHSNPGHSGTGSNSSGGGGTMATSAAVASAGEPSYKVKTVSFKGRRVPIMLQVWLHG